MCFLMASIIHVCYVIFSKGDFKHIFGWMRYVPLLVFKVDRSVMTWITVQSVGI